MMGGSTKIDQVYDSNLPNSSFLDLFQLFYLFILIAFLPTIRLPTMLCAYFNCCSAPPSTWHIPRVFVLNSAKSPVALLYLRLVLHQTLDIAWHCAKKTTLRLMIVIYYCS